MNPIIRLRGDGKSRTGEFTGAPMTLGSSSRCDLYLAGKGFSSEHLRVELTHEGLVVQNLDAAGNTVRNGQRIDRRLVKHRDVMVCGEIAVEFFFRPSGMMTIADGDLVLELLDPPLKATLAKLPHTAEQMLTVGRLPSCDIQILQRRVSGHHAVIMKRANGTLVVIDKASRNGTFINGRKINSAEPAEIHTGDVIEFGAFGVFLRQSNPATDPEITLAPGTAIRQGTGGVNGRSRDPQDESLTAADVVVGESARDDDHFADEGTSDRMPAIPNLTNVPKAAIFEASDSEEDVPLLSPDDAVSPRPASSVRPPSNVRPPSGIRADVAPSRPASSVRAPMAQEGVLPAEVPERSAPPADWVIAAHYAKVAGSKLEAVVGPALVALPGPTVIEPPAEQPRTIRLRGSMVIGRKKNVAIRLLNQQISGIHAMLDPIVGQSDFVLRDTGSENGIYVNGASVDAHPLAHLDRITVGPFHFLYVAADRPFPPVEKEWPKEVRQKVTAIVSGPLTVRRPAVAVVFEVVSVLMAVGLIATLILAEQGVLPPLQECADALGRVVGRWFGD